MTDSLLFIPDISGFTRFVNRTEVEHGRHIIAELLDLIVESDRLGLTVSELEGDAVFFYRRGPLPTFEELAAQARRTFEAFHQHLKRYEQGRICRCGACEAAHDLSLKIVAHAGPIELLSVQGFRKPYGSDVIVAHRLLKNDLASSEYLLVTDSVLPDPTRRPEPPGWSELRAGSATLDDVGVVPFHWVPLQPLLDGIPDPPPLPEFERSRRPLVRTIGVDRPALEVFELITNLDLRLSWSDGVEDFQYEKGRVNRVGTRHRCIIDGSPIDFESVVGDFGEGRLVYGEYLPKSPIAEHHVNYFIVEPDGTGSTVRFEVHYRSPKFPRSLVMPLFRLRMARIAEHVLTALKGAAEARAPGAPFQVAEEVSGDARLVGA